MKDVNKDLSLFAKTWMILSLQNLQERFDNAVIFPYYLRYHCKCGIKVASNNVSRTFKYNVCPVAYPL